MPITPLHIGVLAPINLVAPGKVSAVSFVVTQLILDAATIRFFLTGHGGVDHSSHTFHTALVLAAALGLTGFWSARWVWGAFIGTFSHVLLDALVHGDVYPMHPWLSANPLYLGAMEPLSLILFVLSAWWLLQEISAALKWAASNRKQAKGLAALAVISKSTITRLHSSFQSHFVRRTPRSWGRGACLFAIMMLALQVE